MSRALVYATFQRARVYMRFLFLRVVFGCVRARVCVCVCYSALRIGRPVAGGRMGLSVVCVCGGGPKRQPSLPELLLQYLNRHGARLIRSTTTCCCNTW
jgi:hypothetical protein